MNEGSLHSEERGNGIPAREKPIRCDVEHCGLPAISSVDLHFFCLYHFIGHCYDRLERCKTSHLGLNSENLESEDRFLRECAEQAANLVCPLRGFDNLDRARLFDIFLWASELIAKRAGASAPSNTIWTMH